MNQLKAFAALGLIFSASVFAEPKPLPVPLPNPLPNEHKQGMPPVGNKPAVKVPLKFACEKELTADNKIGIRLIAPGPRDATLVNNLVRAGKEGTFFLALDNQVGKTKSDYLKGADAAKARLNLLDDGLIPGLFDSIEKHNAAVRLAAQKEANFGIGKTARESDGMAATLVNNTRDFEYLKVLSVQAFRTNPYKMEVWTALRKAGSFPNAAAEKLGKKLDELFAKREAKDDDWTAAVTAAAKTDEWKKPDAAWVEVLSSVAKAYGEMAKKQLSKQDNAPSLNTYFASLAAPQDVPKENAFFRTLVLDYAVQKNAATIFKLYCDALKEKKELVVTTNDTSLQPLVDAIVTASKGNIPLTIRQNGIEQKVGGEIEETRPLPKPNVIDVGELPPEKKGEKKEEKNKK